MITLNGRPITEYVRRGQGNPQGRPWPQGLRTVLREHLEPGKEYRPQDLRQLAEAHLGRAVSQRKIRKAILALRREGRITLSLLPIKDVDPTRDSGRTSIVRVKEGTA